MGDPALADPSKIPSLPHMPDLAWQSLLGYLHYDANYLLIVDNLSNLAHLAFVHTNTLGGSEEYAYVSKPLSIDKNERGYIHADAPLVHFRRTPAKLIDAERQAETAVPALAR